VEVADLLMVAGGFPQVEASKTQDASKDFGSVEALMSVRVAGLDGVA
jgi:hypothetical protein